MSEHLQLSLELDIAMERLVDTFSVYSASYADVKTKKMPYLPPKYDVEWAIDSALTALALHNAQDSQTRLPAEELFEYVAVIDAYKAGLATGELPNEEQVDSHSKREQLAELQAGCPVLVTVKTALYNKLVPIVLQEQPEFYVQTRFKDYEPQLSNEIRAEFSDSDVDALMKASDGRFYAHELRTNSVQNLITPTIILQMARDADIKTDRFVLKNTLDELFRYTDAVQGSSLEVDFSILQTTLQKTLTYLVAIHAHKAYIAQSFSLEQGMKEAALLMSRLGEVNGVSYAQGTDQVDLFAEYLRMRDSLEQYRQAIM